jgi:hypothetical protein
MLDVKYEMLIIMASFKELEVFKLSVKYVKSIYQITQSYPKE